MFDNEQFAKYVRPDELHLAFNFRLVRADFDAPDIRGAIENSLAAAPIAGATPTWTLANHDVDRAATRYGGGPVGLARARAMALVMLALPGAVFIYNGEELGLPNVDLPDEALQDPVWERSGRTERGRDASRVPMPWHGSSAAVRLLGESRHLVADAAALGRADGGEADRRSGLHPGVLPARSFVCGRNAFHFTENDVEWLNSPADVLAFFSGGGLCVLNAGAAPVELPDGELLAPAGPLWGAGWPPDSAAWLRRRLSAAPAPGRPGAGTPNRTARRCAARPATPARARSRRRRIGVLRQKPIAVKANTHRIGTPDGHRRRLTASTSWSSSDAGGPCALPCSLASSAPRCARSSITRGRHIVEVHESRFRGKNTSPRGVHRDTRIDVSRCVGLAASPAASASAPADKSAGVTRPTTTRLASTSNPVAPPCRDHAVVAGRAAGSRPRRPAAQRAFDEGRQVLTVGGVGVRARSPRSASAHRSQRCKYSRCLRRKPVQPLLLDVHGGQLRTPRSPRASTRAARRPNAPRSRG